MRALDMLRRAQHATARSLGAFVTDVGRGMLEVSHNTLALVGAIATVAVVFAVSQPIAREQVESFALQWLQTRAEQRELAGGNVLATVTDLDAVNRATAADLKSLNSEQSNLAQWIARRYRVAAEPVGALVREAYSIGQRAGLDPTLILAIVAVESSFNPFAQSNVGAQGLMQVMTRVHDDKFERFGGMHAAFDPIANLRVGVQVLKDCIARAGSVREGLRYYVGAALLEHDGGYAARVMAEQGFLRAVADGRRLPTTVQHVPPAIAAGASAAAAIGAQETTTKVAGRDSDALVR